MTGKFWLQSILFLMEFCLVSFTEGAAPYIPDNSSERQESYDPHATQEERWADSAYKYISNLDCKNVFLTTSRECWDLINIQRSNMIVNIASPSLFAARYRALLPDESLTRTDSHDAVVVVDPYPLANFGHLVIVFYVDNNVNQNDCRSTGGIYVGQSQCMTLALRKRCKNALERRARRRNFARRCEINFLPVVQLEKSAVTSSVYPGKRENHLECRSNLAGFGLCPELRTENETSALICNPIRDNTKRCSTTHETVHTSCRVFEVCDQAVLISGGWNRQTTGTRHLRNLELFYWMLRENGFKRRNIKIFFANGASGMTVPGEHMHQVHPAAMKLAMRYHIQTLCGTRHCAASLVIYMNSPAKNDGTSLLWDVDGNGIAEYSEQYTLDELKFDLENCEAKEVHMIVDQSYAGEVAQSFRKSEKHRNVIVFASGKDHEYSFNDDYTIHWIKANHKRSCSRQVHENILNGIKSSSPIMHEGEHGLIRSTIFGAPCDVTPPFTDREFREKYFGCQNLSTAVWLQHMFDQKGKKDKSDRS